MLPSRTTSKRILPLLETMKQEKEKILSSVLCRSKRPDVLMDSMGYTSKAFAKEEKANKNGNLYIL